MIVSKPRWHASKSAEAISEIIRDTLAQFRGPAGQEDDLTFVIAKMGREFAVGLSEWAPTRQPLPISYEGLPCIPRGRRALTLVFFPRQRYLAAL